MNKVDIILEKKWIRLTSTDWKLLEVKWKVGRRIYELLREDSICRKFTKYRRKNNSNCFLTANYVWFGETKWIWKLKWILRSAYKLPDYSHHSNTESFHEAHKSFWYPFYWEIINPESQSLHAFIVIWEIWDTIICFHQRWDKWKYEFISLKQIIADFWMRHYHIWYWSLEYYERCKFTKIP